MRPARPLLDRATRREERGAMFAAVRHYADVDLRLLDEIAGNGAGLRRVVGAVPGATGCEVIRTRDGFITVLYGLDEPSVIEAGRRMAAWLAWVSPGVRAATPHVWAGPVLAGTAAGEDAPSVTLRSR